MIKEKNGGSGASREESYYATAHNPHRLLKTRVLKSQLAESVCGLRKLDQGGWLM